MEDLINELRYGPWNKCGEHENGSIIYRVDYNDGYIQFWNSSNNKRIDVQDVKNSIADLISDEGLDISNNSVYDGYNEVTFEIFDKNY